MKRLSDLSLSAASLLRERAHAPVAVRLARRPRAAAGVAVAFLVLFFFGTGLLGLDFGRHWDEPYQITGLAECIQKLTLFPQYYIYNGLYFGLGVPVVFVLTARPFAAAVGDLFRAPPPIDQVGSLPAVRAFQQSAAHALRSPAYLLGTRGLFLAISTLAVVWVFLTVLRLYPRRYLPAVAAAAFLAGCWEFQYHARFIAVDAPIAALAALELLLLTCAATAPPRGRATRWYGGAAVVAGLMLACKATALIGLVPIVIFPWLVPETSGGRARGRLLLTLFGLLVLFVIAFVFSPAVFLDPFRYIAQFRETQRQYNLGAIDHPHYVTGVFEHVRRLLVWFVAVVPSSFVLPALCFSGLAAVGGAELFRRHRPLTLTWLTFVAALIMGMTPNRLLIVRNYLVLIPFMAVAFGAGVMAVGDRLKRPDLKYALALLVAGTVVADGAWMFTAGLSVRTTTEATINAAVQRDLERHRRPIRVSPAIHDLMEPTLEQYYRCQPAVLDQPVPRSVLLRYTEYDDPKWRANRLHFHKAVYSSWEVDYDWNSPAWMGKFFTQRVVRITLDDARAIGMDMSHYWDCVPR
jgi:hypothetical protein